jgi:hypothetical protein
MVMQPKVHDRHASDYDAVEKKGMLQAMKMRSKTEYTPFKMIFDGETLRWKQTQMLHTKSSKHAAKKRSKTLPNVPRTLLEFGQSFASPNNLRFGFVEGRAKKPFFRRVVHGNEREGTIVVFASPKM